MKITLSAIITLALFYPLLSSAASEISLLKMAAQIKATSEKPGFNASSCASTLEALHALVEPVDFHKWDLQEVQKSGDQILRQMFLARLALHKKLPGMTDTCANKIRDIYYSLHRAEDMVGVLFYKDPQISAQSLDFQSQPIPVYQKEAYRPYQLAPGFDDKEKFKFRNGDIMITKGVSFNSSTISEMADNKSVFSHIVFVHVNDKTGEARTIESYIGEGVSFFDMDFALKNENARILVLRPKDAAVAARAADIMAARVEALKVKGEYIAYDYQLDFNENVKMSCEEVAFDGFKLASDGKFIIPEHSSHVSFKNEDFLNRLGVKRGVLMTPTDMEVDSRFDIVLDWTDYRVMRDSWRKDAVVSEMMRWMDSLDYKIHWTWHSVGAQVAWAFRPIPGVWPLIAKATGLPKGWTPDVPSKTVAIGANIKKIGNTLLPLVEKADVEYQNKTGSWMTREELKSVLENIRKEDLALYEQKKSSLFHGFFNNKK